MSNYDNTTRRFPAAFGGQQRRGGGGGYNNRGGAGRGRYQEVRYPAPEKKEVPKTVNVASELDFPSLGSDGWTTSKPTFSSGTSSFASLAHKWKSDEEEEEAKIQYEKEQAERKRLEESRYVTTSRILAKGYTTQSKLYKYEEEDDEEYDQYAELDRYEEEMKRQKSEEDNWATVERR